MAVATLPEVMTAEDLLALPEDGYRYELVEGEIIRMSPPSGEHGSLAGRFVHFLYVHEDSPRPGHILVETGFILTRDPDTVRSPDVSYIRRDRVSREQLQRGFIPGAPDLAVEIMSPSDTVAETLAKVQAYLAAGTLLVVVLEPRTQSVSVYRPDGTARVLRAAANDTLELPEVMVGFKVAVSELFDL